MIDPVSEFPIESELEEALMPKLREIDKLIEEDKFKSALEKLVSLNPMWLEHPAVRFRFLTVYFETDNALGAKEQILALQTRNISSEHTLGLFSQSLFHCHLNLGDLDAAEVEAREYFSKNPDGHPPYRVAYEELLRLRKEWTDEEIAASILAKRKKLSM